MRLLLVCITILLPLAGLRAQTDNQPRVSISGIVLNSVTGEPVRGAMVELAGNERKTAMSGPDGHFQMDSVYAGYANISARRPGFDQQTRPQHIKIEAGMDTVVVKINPLSKIAGRIFDREGEPIEGVLVRCLVEVINNGRKQWQPHNGATSDEAGNFLLEDLTPGTYVIGTQEKQLYFARPTSEAARYIYPPTYYPDSPTRDLAQRLEVTAGQELRIDMTLRSARGNRISFTTVPASPSGAFASIAQDDDQFGGTHARADKTGTLIFPAVPPGSWKIIVRGPYMPARNGAPNNTDQMYGELPIEVGATDIQNLKVPIAKVADIPVNVTGVQNRGPIYLQLFGKNGMVNGTNQDQNGEMKIHAVQPGTYRAVVPFTGGSNCVTSIMSGSQDLLRDELVVAPGSSVAPIQVVESSNCAQLTINISSKEPAWVLLASDGKGAEPRMLNSVSSGYTATGLGEGDYRVYAFDDGSNLEYANPEALRPFKSQAVHLEAGQKATVQLEVNERRAQ